MRLTNDQIEAIAYRVVNDLRRAGLIAVDAAEEVEATVQAVIVEELQLEDRLNDEVRERDINL